MSRNSGILLICLLGSFSVGNIIGFFYMDQVKDIDSSLRVRLMLATLSVGFVGTLSFLILLPTPWDDTSDLEKHKKVNNFKLDKNVT